MYKLATKTTQPSSMVVPNMTRNFFLDWWTGRFTLDFDMDSSSEPCGSVSFASSIPIAVASGSAGADAAAGAAAATPEPDGAFSSGGRRPCGAVCYIHTYPTETSWLCVPFPVETLCWRYRTVYIIHCPTRAPHQLPDGRRHGREGRLCSFRDNGCPYDSPRVVRGGSVVAVPSIHTLPGVTMASGSSIDASVGCSLLPNPISCGASGILTAYCPSPTRTPVCNQRLYALGTRWGV